jgi:hypothetical protein
MVSGGDELLPQGARLAQLMRPEILIINDVDRLSEDDQLRLLDILDSAKRYARLVFITTNHYRRLLEPLRRPGRTDDLIQVPGLCLEEILTLAPSAVSLAERMIGWPIAYVLDIAQRINVLGLDAVNEFEQVEQRLLEIRQDGRYV